MSEATRDALAIVGLFYLMASAAYLVCRAVHEYSTHRAVEARMKALVVKGTRTPASPLYGNPSVLPRTFDDWLAEVDLEKAGFNAHNN